MKKIFALILPVALAAGCAHQKDQGAPDSGTAATTGTYSSQSSSSTGGTSSDATSSSSSSSSQLSGMDAKFVKEAAVGGLAEVKMGYLASQNGSSSQVKDLGQKLVSDHTAANKELEQIITRKGGTVLTEIDSKHQKALDSLAKLNGAEFDKAFLHHAVMDHQKDIKEFQTASQSLKNQELRAFAQKQLPILQQHLDMAKNGSDSHHGTTSSTDSGSTGNSSSSSGNSSSSNSSGTSSTGNSNNSGTPSPDSSK